MYDRCEWILTRNFDSEFDTETSMTASDWIGAFKGPNACAQRFRLFASHSFVSEKTSGFLNTELFVCVTIRIWVRVPRCSHFKYEQIR